MLDADLFSDAPSIVPADGDTIPLANFIRHYRGSLLNQIAHSNPPVYQHADPLRAAILDGLKRKPFPKQAETVQALAALMLDRGEKLGTLYAEMGTGKTMMAICLAAILHEAGIRRHLVLSPPHLVYKWRREILDTIPHARVWILNGPDSIAKLLAIRSMLANRPHDKDEPPEFFVLGRVRMRMGFHWRVSAIPKRILEKREVMRENGRMGLVNVTLTHAACPDCFAVQVDSEGLPVAFDEFVKLERKGNCPECNSRLWTLMRPGGKPIDPANVVKKALMQLPTIGEKTAERLISTFGADFLGAMIEDNIYEFTNLLDGNGDLVFTDRQAERMERSLSKMEFSLNGGAPYQPTEFIKRYMPRGSFGLLIVDEGHEYKAQSSAQGQAFGVLAGIISRVLLLTGTLIGGYADDLFYLLFRAMPHTFIADGFRFNAQRSLGTAAMAFMQQYGILKHVHKEKTGGADFKTAKGSKRTVQVSRAPGFSPKGLARYVLPFTAFLKLRDIGGSVLPPYTERYINVPMTPQMADTYGTMQRTLLQEMRAALAKGDHSLIGVVTNALLRWPETCFRSEVIRHPRSKNTLFYGVAAAGDEPTPKEQALIDLVLDEKRKGRRVLIYTTYTDKHDTTARHRVLLQKAGIKLGVLKASVPTEKREDWIQDQVDGGIDALECNPELVKTGLDLLEFPTIVFLNTGFNTFTLQQASRRSWRIGQRHPVCVVFMGYFGTAQILCLQLMSRKIQVAQSTAGDMPDTGLSQLDEESDAIDVALAKELLAA